MRQKCQQEASKEAHDFHHSAIEKNTWILCECNSASLSTGPALVLALPMKVAT